MTKKQNFLSLVWIGTLVMLGLQTLAIEPSDFLSESEKAIVEKIRTKSYPGGVDEGTLKVQTELNTQQSLLNSENSANQSNDDGF